ncbi:MAG: hypothetical protein ACRDU0_03150 [Mycobacterium sp.]
MNGLMRLLLYLGMLTGAVRRLSSSSRSAGAHWLPAPWRSRLWRSSRRR